MEKNIRELQYELIECPDQFVIRIPIVEHVIPSETEKKIILKDIISKHHIDISLEKYYDTGADVFPENEGKRFYDIFVPKPKHILEKSLLLVAIFVPFFAVLLSRYIS